MPAAPIRLGSNWVAGESPATQSVAHSANQPADMAGSMMADVGFLLVPGRPADEGAAYLLIALRRTPTGRHFDPERVDLWTVEDGQAAPTSVTWLSPPPLSRRHLWGSIRMSDRVRAANLFVSFGGDLTVTHSHDVRVVRFKSDAPIVLLSEHAGPADTLGSSIAAFFATLRAAAGESIEIRDRALSMAPLGIYAAYLELTSRGQPPAIATDLATTALHATLRSERERLLRSHGCEFQDGRDLAVAVQRLIRRQRHDWIR
jgi:hypothetical protein